MVVETAEEVMAAAERGMALETERVLAHLLEMMAERGVRVMTLVAAAQVKVKTVLLSIHLQLILLPLQLLKLLPRLLKVTLVAAGHLLSFRQGLCVQTELPVRIQTVRPHQVSALREQQGPTQTVQLRRAYAHRAAQAYTRTASCRQVVGAEAGEAAARLRTTITMDTHLPTTHKHKLATHTSPFLPYRTRASTLVLLPK